MGAALGPKWHAANGQPAGKSISTIVFAVGVDHSTPSARIAKLPPSTPFWRQAPLVPVVRVTCVGDPTGGGAHAVVVTLLHAGKLIAVVIARMVTKLSWRKDIRSSFCKFKSSGQPGL